MRYIINASKYIIISFFCFSVRAQVPICGSAVNLENNCNDACVVCDLNGVFGVTSHTSPGIAPPGYCTQVVHSIRYFGFIAGSTNLSFNVRVLGCTIGNSIELGVYESQNCGSFSLVSNCNTAMPVGVHSFASTAPLKIGCIYYIVIDGNGPAACSFSITVTGGSTVAPIPKLTGQITGKTNVCEGDIETYSIQGFVGACSNQWEVINGDVLSSNKTSVTVQWTTKGNGKICAIGMNACHEKKECIDVNVYGNTESDLGIFYTCPNQTVKIINQNYYSGNYELAYKNFTGCDSFVKFMVIDHELDPIQIDTIVCYPECFQLNNKTFCTSGKFEEKLKMKGFPFCDSLINLNLTVIKNNPVIRSSGNFSCSDTIVYLYSDSSKLSGADSYTYIWEDSLGNIVDSTPNISIKKAGLYSLKIKAIIGKYSCEQQNTIQILGNTKTPDLVLLSPFQICVDENIILNKISWFDNNNTSPDLSYYFKDNNSYHILDTFSKISFTTDTVIYIIANSGSCSDTLEVPIKLNELPKLRTNDIYVCQGETINLNSIKITPLNTIQYYVKFYSTPILMPPFLADSIQQILRDTQFYFFAFNNYCSDTFKVNIFAKPSSNSNFIIKNKPICETDSIELIFPNLQPSEIKEITLLQKNYNISTNKISIPNLPIGHHQIISSSLLNGCGSTTTDSFEVRGPDLPPTINCNSTDSTILFSWNKNPNGKIIELIEVNTNGNKNILNDSILINSLKPGQFAQIKLLLKDSICGDQLVEATCRAISCPNTSIKLTRVDTICLDTDFDQSFYLTATINNPQQNFNKLFFGKGIIDSINGKFDPKISGTGLHKIRVKYFNDYCETFDEIFIRVRMQPKIEFEMDTIVCLDSFHFISIKGNKDIEDIDEINLPDALIASPNPQRTYSIKYKTAGLKTIKYKIKNGVCIQEIQKNIHVFAAPKTQIINCESSNSKIIFSWNSDINTKNFKIRLIPNYNYIRTSDTSITVDQLAPDTDIQIELISESIGDCTDKFTLSKCRTNSCPKLNLLKDSILYFCKEDPVPIRLDSLLLFPTNGTWLANSKLNNSIILDKKLLNIGHNLIQFSATVDNCNHSDTSTIIMGSIPITEIIKNTLDCTEENRLGFIHCVSTNNGIPPFNYTLNNQSSQNGKFDQLLAGKYSLTIGDSLQCDTTFYFEFNKIDTPILNLGVDVELKKGETLVIPSKVKGHYQQIEWTPTDYLDCLNCLQPLCKPEKSILYTAEIIDSLNCRSRDSIFIKILDHSIYIPNTFSPNFDGLNDVFTVYGTGDVKQINYISIFDRWGELLFSKRNYPLNAADLDQSWNGIYNGQLLLPSVYIYLIEVEFKNGEIQRFSGDINLIK
jgi:gliding motility-associated-like protein